MSGGRKGQRLAPQLGETRAAHAEQRRVGRERRLERLDDADLLVRARLLGPHRDGVWSFSSPSQIDIVRIMTAKLVIQMDDALLDALAQSKSITISLGGGGGKSRRSTGSSTEPREGSLPARILAWAERRVEAICDACIDRYRGYDPPIRQLKDITALQHS